MVTATESLDWIANHYGVPARKGQHIRFAGALARITGATGPHLRARMLATCRWASEGQDVTLHPTWEIEYLDSSPQAPHRGEATCLDPEKCEWHRQSKAAR